MTTLDRTGDNRWNRSLDLLIETWNKLGPDLTVAYLTMAAESVITPEGVVQIRMAAAEQAGKDAPRGDAA